MRAIDADVIISQCKEYSNLLKYDGTTDREWALVKRIILMINEQPTIDPQHKKGRWIDDKGNPVKIADGATNRSCWCSVCGEWLTASDEYNTKGNFCPNCGADMREPEDIPMEYFESGGR